MNLVKLITAIDYSSIPEGLDHRNKLLKYVTGDDNAKINRPSIAENLEIRIKNKKLYINIGLDRTGAEINQPETVDTAIHEVFSIIKKINNYVNWTTVTRIGVRSIWINPYSGTFQNLLAHYKKHIFSNEQFLIEAPDVGIALTLHDNGRRTNYVSGPMEKKQLISSFLPKAPFEEDKLPEVFTFVDCDYFILGNVDYSNTYIDKFIKRGVDFSQTKALEIAKILNNK